VLISVSRPGSPSPLPTAKTPTPMMIARPDSSMSVSTTLALTECETPKKLMSASMTTNSTATMAMTAVDSSMSSAAGR
jgi:hypothetical protein